MMLGVADLLAILGSLIIVVGGALAWLRADIRRLDTRFSSEIRNLDTRLSSEIRNLDARLNSEIRAVNTQLRELEEQVRANAAKVEADFAKVNADIARLNAEVAHLSAGLAKLDERQRADIAAINSRLDTLTQTILASMLARGSQTATEPVSQPESVSTPTPA